MEKLYDSENNIRGYRIGSYYLLKHYTWGNKCDWYISKEDKGYFFSCEISRACQNGKIEFVESFKQGKQRIMELSKV